MKTVLSSNLYNSFEVGNKEYAKFETAMARKMAELQSGER